MNDVECPYCGKEVEINHDDGYGMDENGIHQQQCGYCDKYFIYTTMISIDHEAEKADCLNGAEHKFKLTFTYPKQFTRLRCECCGEEKPLSSTVGE